MSEFHRIYLSIFSEKIIEVVDPAKYSLSVGIASGF